MSVKIYDKLVRDRIPEIIAASGKSCACARLADADYLQKLNEKLLEEAHEYLQSGDTEELADLCEVVRAILAYKGVPMADFERLRQQKAQARGGFEKRLLLQSVTDGE